MELIPLATIQLCDRFHMASIGVHDLVSLKTEYANTNIGETKINPVIFGSVSEIDQLSMETLKQITGVKDVLVRTPKTKKRYDEIPYERTVYPIYRIFDGKGYRQGIPQTPSQLVDWTAKDSFINAINVLAELTIDRSSVQHFVIYDYRNNTEVPT